MIVHINAHCLSAAAVDYEGPADGTTRRGLLFQLDDAAGDPLASCFIEAAELNQMLAPLADQIERAMGSGKLPVVTDISKAVN